MSTGVMNFKDSILSSSKFYVQSYRPVTLLRASAQQDWEFRDRNRRFLKGCVIIHNVRIFSSSELVEAHIIPLKVCLAVTLHEEAKWQVFVRDCEHWILSIESCCLNLVVEIARALPLLLLYIFEFPESRCRPQVSLSDNLNTFSTMSRGEA